MFLLYTDYNKAQVCVLYCRKQFFNVLLKELISSGLKLKSSETLTNKTATTKILNMLMHIYLH